LEVAILVSFEAYKRPCTSLFFVSSNKASKQGKKKLLSS